MNHMIGVTRQTCRKVFIRVGRFVMANLLLVALASPVQAQTFNDAVEGALEGACLGIDPRLGSLLDTICPAGDAASTSSGSPAALSGGISLVEKRKALRLIGPWSLFLSGEYERFDKNVTTFESGHTTDTWRAAVGADYSFSHRFVFGGAFNYVNDDGNFQSGGRFETDAYGVLLHAIFAPTPKSFLDATAGYTWKNHFISRVVSFTKAPTVIDRLPTTSDTDGNAFNVGVNGGYNFAFQNVTIGPRFGLHYNLTKIDGYPERGNTGLELVYDDQTEKSLTSVLGMYGSMAISTGFGVLTPQTTLEYVHEIEDDQRVIGFHFADDLSRTGFRFQNDSPDRNYFNIGAGIVMVLPNGFSPFVNYRALVGYQDRSRYGVAAGLRIEL